MDVSSSAEQLSIAAVPLQGAYVARQCPVRAQNDADTSIATVPASDSDAAQLRAEAGIAYQDTIFSRLAATIGTPSGRTVVTIADGHRAGRQAETAAAVAAGAALILGGWLPDDEQGRRTGQPDVLVRVGSGDGAGYVPIEVKHHTVARRDRPDAGTAPSSPLDAIDPLHPVMAEDVEFSRRYHRDDGMQLAHYWRMLEVAGWSPDPSVLGPRGGIIDKAGFVWWIDLASPTWIRWWDPEPVSLLGWYKDEFAWRLAIIANQLARNADPAVPPLVEPVRVSECDTCPWRSLCLPALAAADHVSLLPRTTLRHFLHQKELGVTTRRHMAELDWTTAWVAQGDSGDEPSVDLDSLLAAARDLQPHTPLATLTGMDDDASAPVLHGDEHTAPRDRVAAGRLAALGLQQVADLATLDERTAALASRGAGHLPTLIDQARAIISAEPHRRRRVRGIDARRADIEIDLDMENMPEGVYLWGTLTTIRAGADAQGFTPGYRPFVHWAAITDRDASPAGALVSPHAEQRLLAQTVQWLHDTVAAAQAQGLTIGIYMWSRAEENAMRKIMRAVDHDSDPGFPLAQAEELLTSPCWVDLLPVFADQVLTGQGNGLKVVAPLAGFAWRDEDPGGEQSQVWYRRAVSDPDPAVRAAYRERILTYNEDDVLATRAVREWLDGPGQSIPSIETWTPPQG